MIKNTCNSCDNCIEDYSTDYLGDRDYFNVCKKHGFHIPNKWKYTCDDNTEDEKENKVNFRKVR